MDKADWPVISKPLLTKVIHRADNTGMKWLMLRILVPIHCWLLVMPLGWCCWLVPSLAVARTETPEPACCCCCDREENAPAKPKEAPDVPPCCCKPLPMAFLTMPDDTDAPLPALPVMFESPQDFIADFMWMQAVIHIDPSPPLHILHCLWLC